MRYAQRPKLLRRFLSSKYSDPKSYYRDRAPEEVRSCRFGGFFIEQFASNAHYWRESLPAIVHLTCVAQWSAAQVFSQMTMKTSIPIVGLLAAVSAFGVPVLPFTSWDDISKKSPDIIIARCTATTPEGPIADGMVWSDIEVLSVLKGDTKPGAARMVSQHAPRQGDRFLMFSTYQSNDLYRAYNATETYRVVPLGGYFSSDELKGKTLEEQIRLLLQHRLEDLTRELQQGAVEKKRLEEALKR